MYSCPSDVSRTSKQDFGSNLIQSGIDIPPTKVLVFSYLWRPQMLWTLWFEEDIGHALVLPYPLKYPFGWMGLMMNGTILPRSPAKFAGVTALSKPEFWSETVQIKKFGNRA